MIINMDEKYYILIYLGSSEKVFTYCTKTIFNLEDAILHKERWEKKNYPYRAGIFEEINVDIKIRDSKIEKTLNED
jgi:hypothetical protein